MDQKSIHIFYLNIYKQFKNIFKKSILILQTPDQKNVTSFVTF